MKKLGKFMIAGSIMTSLLIPGCAAYDRGAGVAPRNNAAIDNRIGNTGIGGTGTATRTGMAGTGTGMQADLANPFTTTPDLAERENARRITTNARVGDTAAGVGGAGGAGGTGAIGRNQEFITDDYVLRGRTGVTTTDTRAMGTPATTAARGGGTAAR